MKKYAALCFVLAVSTVLFSFSAKRGGDVFEIYLNGKKMLQQFAHIDKSVKTLYLASLSDNDRIDVFYSHCGQQGTNRAITIRNEKNEVIKKLSFADSKDNHSLMSFYRKDIAKDQTAKLNLYYSAKELPEGRLLATLVWSENKVIAQR
jgi:hypothetical protein